MIILCLLGCKDESVKSEVKMNNSKFPINEDVATIDGLIKASYEVVSGEKGTPRQWERDLSLHHPKAVYAWPPRGGGEQQTMTLDEFHSATDELILSDGFFENEIDRKVQRFGNMAHIWSTYESRTSKNGEPFSRGINSIQVYNDGQRWWIVSWVFDRESPMNRIE